MPPMQNNFKDGSVRFCLFEAFTPERKLLQIHYYPSDPGKRFCMQLYELSGEAGKVYQYSREEFNQAFIVGRLKRWFPEQMKDVEFKVYEENCDAYLSL